MSVFRDTLSVPQLRVTEMMVALAFWSAVVLPFVYVPLLVTGLDTVGLRAAFAALVSLNVVLLVVGHSHRG